jgi:hypothetical protein
MADRVRTCPQCGAPLAPGPFARTVTCAYCNSVVELDPGVVQAARFRAAHAAWTDGSAGQDSFQVGSERWLACRFVAHGEIADVFQVERVRKPAELALLKVLRDAADRPMLEQEWNVLRGLHASSAPGAVAIVPRLPQPLARARVEGGARAGAEALALRWAAGFEHTLAELRGSITPQQSVWMWRRVLEILAFVHASGCVHGAVLPQHLLVEHGEHGLRLVGFGCAGPVGVELAAVVASHEQLYPPELRSGGRLQPRHDLAMSARTLLWTLGADEHGAVPARVPARLAQLFAACAAGDFTGPAFELRERVGALARELFGPPSFHPVTLPTR